MASVKLAMITIALAVSLTTARHSLQNGWEEEDFFETDEHLHLVNDGSSNSSENNSEAKEDGTIRDFHDEEHY